MKLFVRVLIFFLAVSSAAWPQTSTSEITGVVNDSSGARIPGADVTLTNEATGLTYRQQSTQTGVFDFPSIPVGSYTLTAELKGFKTFKKTGNTLQVGTPLSLEATLEVGLATEVITVEARGEVLQTTNAALGNVVERAAIVSLPLNGRNPLTLLVLEPGVVQR